MAAWSLVCGLALRASVAAAQTVPALPERWPEAAPPPPSRPVERPVERWYGWQTLLADAGAVTLTIWLSTSVDEHNDAAVIGAVVAGVGSFVFGGPIVHAAHGHWTKAAGSLGLRAGLMLLGGGIGAAIGADACSQYVYDHEGCAIGDGAVGLMIGAVMATILDAAVLGREQIAAHAGGAPTLAFTPLRDGGGLSIIGRF